jgi:SAM-dependent methyltransferase
MTSDNPHLPEANMQSWSEDTVRHLREHYDEAATYWGKWADPMAEQQIKVNQALLVAAGVKPGAQLLDLASGAGEPAVTASAMVGDTGLVTATDISEPMVKALAQRMTRLGLSNVSCRQADMEALPFGDASFDAVTCRYGLMYAHDAGRAVAEAARVVRPGGRVAYMVWGPEANNSVIYHGARAANAFLGGVLPEESFSAPTRFAEPGIVSALMVAAGLADAQEQELIFEPRIKVGLPFWAPLLEMNSTHIWTALAPDVQKKVHQAIAQAYESFRDGDSYKLKTHMRIAFARRPQTIEATVVGDLRSCEPGSKLVRAECGAA